MQNNNEHINYRTHQIRIKKGHRLYNYFYDHATKAKNMYNVTNFYFRQIMTAMKSNQALQPLQQQVIDEIKTHLPQMNVVQQLTHEKKLSKELLKPIDERKEVKLTLFKEPTAKKPYVSYRFLDSLLKCMDQVDYRTLPTQTTQAIMKLVFQDWKSFFEAIKDYKQHPQKYRGQPKIPRYKKKDSLKEIVYSNQSAVITCCGKYLSLPMTKTKLNIGKLGIHIQQSNGLNSLKQVCVIPSHDGFVVELVVEVEAPPVLQTDNERYMSIDLGTDRLATLVTNTGMRPILINGKSIKSLNQRYNKQVAHYKSILRQGLQPNKGTHTSKRLDRLHQKRQDQIKDLFHKATHQIVTIARQECICKVVIGVNRGWKQHSNMGTQNNQTFCFIPHAMLINQLRYKLEAVGIELIEQEESYTSKASFVTKDDLPMFDPTNRMHPSFSGYRKSRGLYQQKGSKTTIHADVNGAANILRKALPNAFDGSCANGITGLSLASFGTRSVKRAKNHFAWHCEYDDIKLAGIVSTPLVLSLR